MADKPSLVAMVGFISTNADYIKSAFDIEEAMPQLRQQTAKEFVEGIKPELERDGWEVDNTFVDFSKRADAECMTYRRPHWPLGWGICLGKWEPMSSFYIGLRCPTREPELNDKDRGDIRSAMGPTLSAIDSEQASQSEWAAWTDLPGPFGDWRRADTIALLKGLNRCDDGRTAHETFVAWFRELAAVAEPVLENILRRKA